VKGSTTIYEGGAIGLASGYARELVDGDTFVGFAIEGVVNSSSTDGAINVRVQTRGKIKVTLASVAVTDVGKKVYVSDDGTFTLTASPGEIVGIVYRYVTTNTCIIEFYQTAV
jgi:hypothetical protein